MADLPLHPPRPYTALEALRGRVWRSRAALWGRELSALSALTALYGLLLDAEMALAGGLLALVCVNLASALLALAGHLRRARLVREGAFCVGTLTRKRRRAFLHELLRGAAHRTFEITYVYTPEGENAQSEEREEREEREGRLLLCRCAYEHLSDGEPLHIAYDPRAPHLSVPLRVAVMRIPH